MASFALAALATASAKPPTWVTALIYIAIVGAGGLAALYSLVFLGGRFVWPRSVQARLRAGVIASALVVVLAILDIYLAITAL